MAFTDADFISKEGHELDYVLRKWKKRGTAANRALLVEALDRFNADQTWKPHTRAKFYEFAERDGLVGRLEGAADGKPSSASAAVASDSAAANPRRFRWWWIPALVALVVIALLLLRYCGACSAPSVAPGAPTAVAEAPAASEAASVPAPASVAAAPAQRVLSLAALPAASLAIRFQPDSSELLAPGSEAALTALAAALGAFDEGVLVLVGHAADVGRPAGELRVSEGRARFVASFLEASGLPSGISIRIEARGSAEPAIPGPGATDPLAASRRVEIKVE